jgi:hypothetical protein
MGLDMAVGNQNLTDTKVGQAQTVPGMAYFAGTGPEGKTCADCKYIEGRGVRVFHYWCNKYRQLTTRKNRLAKPDYEFDSPNLKSCKYFEEKPHEQPVPQ